MDDATRLAQCSRCGADLPADAPGGLCPACLLALATPAADATISNEATQLVATGVSSSGDHATVLASASDSSRAGARFSTQLEPGQIFGPYRIEKLLGKGGMGEVYAAEHLEHGRRLALKVLSHRLADRDDRARFLREGQLAASINHPRSVYIFGSEEIDGAPIITMELVPGGTLKDKVTADGPYAPAAAVDAILDIASGLDAAHAAGILHRDIKPSNCFVDHDGTVKIGDFGLSISTLAREVTERTGVFQGTPQYAAPEQLRGEPLDVRADIYAVGATLYYLLTGRAPFDDADLTTLITRVKDEPARSPRAISPKVPKGLAQIVLRCLAKDKTDRPESYVVLSDQLRVFCSATLPPASFGQRAIAFVVDQTVVSLVNAVLIAVIARTALGISTDREKWSDASLIALMFVYYTCLHGVWGATIGKRLFGLRVVGAGRRPPGVARAALRSLIVLAPFAASFTEHVVPLRSSAEVLLGLFPLVYLGLLSLSVGIRNDHAGLHDLASATRVVKAGKTLDRRFVLPTRPDVQNRIQPGRRFGPYEVVSAVGSAGDGELFVAFDATLRRHVWLRVSDPAIATGIPRDPGRPGRLRWLNGRRTPTEAWDAFEAPDGAPLAKVVETPQPWSVVKLWLIDVVVELELASREDSLPALALNRVWITDQGRAKLLDFPAPGGPTEELLDAAPTVASAQAFIAKAAERALGPLLGGGASPWPRPPLSGATALAVCARGGFAALGDARAALAPLAAGPDRGGRGMRAAGLACVALLLAPMILGLLWGMRLTVSPGTPESELLATCLLEVYVADRGLPRSVLGDGGLFGSGEPTLEQRSALEVFVAGQFRAEIADPDLLRRNTAVTEPLSAVAASVRAAHAVVSEPALRDATARLAPFLDLYRDQLERKTARDLGRLTLAVSLPLAWFAVLAMGAALVMRSGPVLRGVGFAVVARDGLEASRIRALWRTTLAWLPALALAAYTIAGVYTGFRISWLVVYAAVGVLVVGGTVAIIWPERGLQDRLAGTWLVPR